MTDLPLVVAPSVLAADLACLTEAADAVSGSADWLHVDVMDNHFVPNLTIGLPVVRALRVATNLPLDCHLMIDNPQRWAIGYAEAGAYNVSIHAEATDDPVSVAADLRSAGSRAGLAIDRDTPIDFYLEILPYFDILVIMTVKAGFGGQSFVPEMLDKVRKARRHANAGHLDLCIEVDGGITIETIEAAAEAGANAFVAGSSVYGLDDPDHAVRALRAVAHRGCRRRGVMCGMVGGHDSEITR